MKLSRRNATIVASVLACVLVTFLIAAQVAAQRPASNRPAAGDRIAVIDINHIFKHHERFKAMVEAWKKDVKAAEDLVRTERQKIDEFVKQLDRFKAGTPEYKGLEEDIARNQASLQASMALQKKDLMKREAKMYLNVYREIQEQVDYFARTNGITLVLRFNRAEIDEEDPRQIQQGLLRQVVFQDRIDITMDILKRLNPASGQRIGTKPNGQAPQSRR